MVEWTYKLSIYIYHTKYNKVTYRPALFMYITYLYDQHTYGYNLYYWLSKINLADGY